MQRGKALLLLEVEHDRPLVAYALERLTVKDKSYRSAVSRPIVACELR
jgi:hypothetical protein